MQYTGIVEKTRRHPGKKKPHLDKKNEKWQKCSSSIFEMNFKE